MKERLGFLKCKSKQREEKVMLGFIVVLFVLVGCTITPVVM